MEIVATIPAFQAPRRLFSAGHLIGWPRAVLLVPILGLGITSASAQEVVATLTSGVPTFGLGVDPTTNHVFLTGAYIGCSVLNGGDDSGAGNIVIPGDSGPIAVDPTNHRIYIANGTYDLVSVGNTATLTGKYEVLMATSPEYLAVNPVTDTAYATDNDGNVTVIDGLLQVVSKTLAIGGILEGIAVDPHLNRIYVVGEVSGQSTLTVIDGTANTVTASVAITNLGPVAVNPVTNLIYVAGMANNSVQVLDGTTYSQVASIQVGTNPSAIAVNTVTNMVYVANGSSANVSVIDGSSMTVVATIGAPTDFPALAVNEATNMVYVSGFHSNTVTVIDAVPIASASVVLSNLNQAFDGTAHGVTVTTIPAGLTTTVTYNGGPGLQYGPGDFAVVATVTDLRYTGTGTGTFSITPEPLPVITLPPRSQTVIVGHDAIFTVTASSVTPVLYEWNLNGVAIDGPDSFGPTYTLGNPQVGNTGNSYSVTVTNYQGSVTSDPVTLTVVAQATLPVISTQPQSQKAAAGSGAAFWTTATGVPSPNYQWNFNGVPIPGATNPLLIVSDAQSGAAGNYTVTVSNSAGSATSAPATLAIDPAGSGAAPIIAQQPSPQTISVGGTVVFTAVSGSTSAQAHPGLPGKSFSVAKGGRELTDNSTGDATYQWFWNGDAMIGASDAVLIINDATAVNNGSYACLVSNASGSVMTAGASLSVISTPDPGRLVNISCRASVGTGPNILIVGFVTGGQGTSGPEPVLIRASGPALTGFGVSGTLPDPQLSLFQSDGNGSSSLLGSNEGWAGNSSVSSASALVGAFPWTAPSSHDSALVENLPTGSFTAQVAGQGGDSGVALAEVYDATPPGAYTAASTRLVNISARVQAGTGANILIAGFVVGGSTARTVLIRASGPALIPFGVSGTLPDPQLTLYQSGPGGASVPLGTNASWGGVAEIAGTAARVGAFSWSDLNSADSAMLVTLPPGAYTAQVAGASGDTGVALIEVYDVQ